MSAGLVDGTASSAGSHGQIWERVHAASAHCACNLVLSCVLLDVDALHTARQSGPTLSRVAHESPPLQDT
eukprot:6173103-Pleurochrysis_carterae.AAC.1